MNNCLNRSSVAWSLVLLFCHFRAQKSSILSFLFGQKQFRFLYCAALAQGNSADKWCFIEHNFREPNFQARLAQDIRPTRNEALDFIRVLKKIVCTESGRNQLTDGMKASSSLSLGVEGSDSPKPKVKMLKARKIFSSLIPSGR